MANWLFQENKASRKIQLSDDGTSRLVLSFVAEYANPSNWNPITQSSTTPAAVKYAPTTMLKDLSNLFPLGATIDPTAFTGAVNNDEQEAPGERGNFDPNESCSSTILWWTVDSYTGAMPARSDRTVWTVQVNLSSSEDPGCALDYPADSSRVRRDIEIAINVGTRQADAFASWYQLDPDVYNPDGNVQYPQYGDSNQGLTGTANYIVPNTLVCVDINGAPIKQSIPQNVITINKIVPFTRETESGSVVSSLNQWLSRIRNNVGFRNSADTLGYRRGQILFTGCDMMQLGRSGVRLTFRFLADDFYHLTQEQIQTPTSNNMLPNGAFTQISYAGSGGTGGPSVTVRHAAAMWRQPYALTTHANSWVLSGTGTTGNLGFNSTDSSYLNTLTGALD